MWLYLNTLQDLNGQETFRNGETESHIEIELPEEPQSEDNETFM